MSKYIGIIGARKRNEMSDFDQLAECFAGVYETGDILVSGGCPKGGDSFAMIIADRLGLDIVIFHPRMPPHCDVGAFRIAAYARNIEIAEKSDALIALVAPERKGGTEFTVSHFRKTKMWANEGNLFILKEKL